MWEPKLEAKTSPLHHCPTCLSRGRVLQTLTSQAYNLLTGLMSSKEQAAGSSPDMVCWECHQRLLNALKFREQALRAKSRLLAGDANTETHYSLLTTTTKQGFDQELEHSVQENKDEKDWFTAIKEEHEGASPEPPKVAKRKTSKTFSSVKNETGVHFKTKKKKITKEAHKSKKKCTDQKVRKLLVSEEEMLKFREEDRNEESYLKAPYKCETCIKPFDRKDQLDRHNNTKHNKEAPHACDVCGERAAHARALAAHRRRHRALYACAACPYTSRVRAELVERHYSETHAPDAYPCRLCGAIFRSNARLRYHRHSMHRQLAECDVCHKLMVKFNLKRHVLVHGGMPTYECELCGAAVRGETGRYAHMSRFHPPGGEQRAYCVECDVQFKSAYTYTAHLRKSVKHNAPDKFKFACDKCERRFLGEGQLRHHQKVDHEEYKCDICNKRLKSYASMRKHVRYVHEGAVLPRRHVCDVCGKRFQGKSTLARHALTHTGERPHACDICGATFAQKAALGTHTRLVHLKLGRKRRDVPD